MPLVDTARTAFLQLLGPENMREGDALPEFRIGDRSPSVALFPGTLDEAAEAARICSEHRLAVVPWGGGTRQGFGTPPSRYDVAFSTKRMDRILDYQPADMTVTVEAGLTLEKLQAALREKGQFLPLDPPFPAQATMGGIAATRDTGALRHAFGNPRDLLIGLKVVDPEGLIVKSGSKVVKNVAGYDLPKLYVGSRGTLGLLAEMTFRVLPLPEVESTVLLTLPGLETVEPLLAALMDSDLVPVMLELLNEPARKALLPKLRPGWSLALGLDGAREDVAWEIDFLHQLTGMHPGVSMERLEGEAGGLFRRALADFPLSQPSRLAARVTLLSSQIAEFSREAEIQGEEYGYEIRLIAHAGVGNVLLHALGNGPLHSASNLLQALRDAAHGFNGFVTVERVAPELEGRVETWPSPTSSAPLMQQIKRTLDSKDLWNPGRFGIG